MELQLKTRPKVKILHISFFVKIDVSRKGQITANRARDEQYEKIANELLVNNEINKADASPADPLWQTIIWEVNP